MDNLSEDDLVDAMRVHFTLLAEVSAELAARNPEKRTVKMSAKTGGFDVRMAMMAKEPEQ